MAEEQTLVLVKPDGVANGHIGEVITRIERRGFTIEALKVTQATTAQLHQHYAALVDKPFFPKVERFMTSGPLVAMVVSGFNVIEAVRKMTGATNPGDAAPGTIRGDFGREWADQTIRNVIHSSDSEESARREIPIWFADKQYAPKS
ncbi:nucleoside-diphosphate kinase [Lacticaseibacillus casei]|jgi:nucleoside-diphosphate kinase|uniref:Nucleoside diphosphate kinase n=1 Tax=Lacticaseibacillus huelsenbergensis TaxID=3035291 RepID=A0ABY8DRQ6_9LACO|nr:MULTISPECIES: nucleoside-diphosphate kinase [Lacticaseibacillus]MDG3062568.1 nucleoside-diphosphate kinase [Lacticaseibacillus sp. BCRC 81376]QVI38381.1 nucleoside-diphosphate kinase [Lacticaseibacillus casei]QXG60194.1 nucleoside-diphosphate kinase [Lacticaseibacillus casei]WFB38330.1 nucleoside-diphosphate kinase [Lacticaseibacillus huelsenbergensis]WFB42754.1 nucleoside-diphosphate kinase [Lacticaseibacillus huelsenbergensis]